MTEQDRRGRRLLEIRQHRGMSQRLLARTVGVSEGTIQNYERGRALMNVDRIEQLARALHCQSKDLLAQPGSPLPKYRMPSERSLERESKLLVPNSPELVGFYGSSLPTDWFARITELHWHGDPVALAAFGLQANMPEQQSWMEWLKRVHADDVSQVRGELSYLNNHGVFAKHYRVVGFDGVERSIIDCGRLTYDEQGRPTDLHGILIDVTHARRTPTVERRIARILRAFRRK